MQTVSLPRPSSVRRIEKMRMLVSALSERDMGYLAAAALLECSPSSARQYLQQLGDAGVLSFRSSSGSYWLNADPAAARHFFDAQPGEKRAPTPGPRVVHNMNAGDFPARRDALVMALFGNAAV